MSLTRPLIALLTASLALSFFTACGEEVEAENQSPNQNQVDPENQSQNQTESECPAGQRLNPFTGACVDEEEFEVPEENQNQPEENQNQGENQPQLECGPGSLIGQACATDGNRLPAATVQLVGVDCEGIPFERVTETDGNGTFFFSDVPSGSHELRVVSGSFESERPVDIFAGEETSLMSDAEKVCLDGDVNIMIFQSTWDDIGSLLDNLELDYTSLNDNTAIANLLSDPAALNEYDIIFVECSRGWGSLSGDTETMAANLRAFVENGGSLYGADLALSYITAAFPEVATYPSVSYGGNTVNADVVSSAMQSLLQSNTVSISFNTELRGISNLNPGAVIHFTAGSSPPSSFQANTPLMISYPVPGGGTVISSAFHNRPGATPEITEIMSFMVFQL